MSEKTPMDRLVDSIESSLADIAETPARLKALERILGAIEQGLSDHMDAATRQRLDLSPLVAAISAIKPTITVMVPPQEPLPPPPAPDMTGATWEIRLPGAYGAPDRVAIVKRTA